MVRGGLARVCTPLVLVVGPSVCGPSETVFALHPAPDSRPSLRYGWLGDTVEAERAPAWHGERRPGTVVRIIKHLIERRVPHVLALYAAASWGLIEFVGFLVDEYILSTHLTRVVLTSLLLLLPSAAMVAWFHGRPGRDDVPLTEKIGIPANFVVAATVVFLLFRGPGLGGRQLPRCP